VEIPVGPNVTPDKKIISPYRLLWQVPYQRGSLKAVAYSGGREVASQEIRTAGAPAKLVLIPDRTVIQADGDDLSFITVRVEDKDGNLCPTADNVIHFQVSGVGAIAAVDNGNAATSEPFHANYRKAFDGLALLIVRSQEQAGSIEVNATSDGLDRAAIKIGTEPVPATTDRRQTGDAPVD
jgi:beta-galactosidase